jgi:ABC-type glycerol-3-phosphate transport system permease component
MSKRHNVYSDRAAGKYIVKISVYLILILATLITSLPVYWGIITSLKPDYQVLRYPPDLFPKTLTLINFEKVLFLTNYPVYIRNSIFIAVVAVVLALFVSGHAAYAFARLKFKHSEKLMFLILMTSMIPIIAELVPLYVISSRLKLYNTRTLLVLLYITYSTPTQTWILKNFFESCPREVEEAASIDGCSRPIIFYRIVLPMAQPGLAACALLSVIHVWNDFLIQSTFISNDDLRMISAGVYNCITQFGIRWGEITAAAVMAIVPVIILFIVLQDRFISGLAAGAVKG